MYFPTPVPAKVGRFGALPNPFGLAGRTISIVSWNDCFYLLTPFGFLKAFQLSLPFICSSKYSRAGRVKNKQSKMLYSEFGTLAMHLNVSKF